MQNLSLVSFRLYLEHGWTPQPLGLLASRPTLGTPRTYTHTLSSATMPPGASLQSPTLQRFSK